MMLCSPLSFIAASWAYWALLHTITINISYHLWGNYLKFLFHGEISNSLLSIWVPTLVFHFFWLASSPKSSTEPHRSRKSSSLFHLKRCCWWMMTGDVVYFLLGSGKGHMFVCYSWSNNLCKCQSMMNCCSYAHSLGEGRTGFYWLWILSWCKPAALLIVSCWHFCVCVF